MNQVSYSKPVACFLKSKTHVSYTYTGNESRISILFIHVSSVIRNLVVRQLLFLSEK